jgi:hypothetical protein
MCSSLSFVVVIFIVVNFLFSFTESFSAFDCATQNWEIQNNDTEIETQRFQKWIYAWQNNCDSRSHYKFPAPSSGMGSSINEAIKHFITGMERNFIYRPDEENLPNKPPGVWIWADHNKSACTLNIRSIDCFAQPMSVCGIDENSIISQKAMIQKDLRAYSTEPLDSCGMAAKSRKSIQWVAAQFTFYMTRLGDNVKDEVIERRDWVFNSVNDGGNNSSFIDSTSMSNPISTITYNNNNNISTTDNIISTQQEIKRMKNRNFSTIGVHLRGGVPDGNMKVMSVDLYMKYVDQIAERLKDTDRPVGLVFFCSHVQEENVISSEHMQATYNRPFKFVILPHNFIGHGEAQWHLQKDRYNKPEINATEPELNLHNLAVDFYTDIEILSSVDYFIGTVSQIYTLVAGKRIASGIHKANNQTCLIDPTKLVDNEYKMHCEGSVFAQHQWVIVHGGMNNPHSHLNFIDMDV